MPSTVSVTGAKAFCLSTWPNVLRIFCTGEGVVGMVGTCGMVTGGLTGILTGILTGTGMADLVALSELAFLPWRILDRAESIPEMVCVRRVLVWLEVSLIVSRRRYTLLDSTGTIESHRVGTTHLLIDLG